MKDNCSDLYQKFNRIRYENEIIEVAPRSAYTDCTFVACEFVGIGRVMFDRCKFINCNMPRRLFGAAFEKCTELN